MATLFYLIMKTKKGMTILETSIAMLVLGITILGILSGIYMASQMSRSTRNRIVAIQIAQTKMEEIKDEEYAEIEDEGLSREDSLPYGTSSVHIDAKDEGKEITVRVGWIEENMERNIELVTFIRKE